MSFSKLYESADLEPYPGGKPLENLRNALPAAIQDFLSVGNHSKDGNWPTIPEDELHNFQRLIRAIALVKWGTDCDHSDPLTIEVREKQVFENVWVSPIERSLDYDEPIDKQRNHEHKRLRAALSGVSSFMSIVEQVQRKLDHLSQEEFKLKMARVIYELRPTDRSSHKHVYFAETVEAEAYRAKSRIKYDAPKAIWAIPSHQVTEADFLNDLLAMFGEPIDRFAGYPNGPKVTLQYSNPA